MNRSIYNKINSTGFESKKVESSTIIFNSTGAQQWSRLFVGSSEGILHVYHIRKKIISRFSSPHLTKHYIFNRLMNVKIQVIKIILLVIWRFFIFYFKHTFETNSRILILCFVSAIKNNYIQGQKESCPVFKSSWGYLD